MSDQGTVELRKRALEAFGCGDHAAAATAFTEWLAANPDDIEARYMLAWSYSRCGMHSQAVAEADIAVRLAPGYAEAHYYRGMALLYAGRNHEAYTALAEAVRLQPGHPQAIAWLGWIRQSGMPVYAPQVPAASTYLAASSPRPASRPAPLWLIFAWLTGVVSVLVFFVGGALMFAGEMRVREERKFPAPQPLPYARAVQQKPKEGWFRLTGCGLNVGRATWLETEYFPYVVSNILIPVESVDDETSTEKVHIFMKVDSGPLAETVEELAEVQRKDDRKALDAWYEKNRDRLWIEPEVEGKILKDRGFEWSSYEQSARSLEGDLAPDWIMLEEHEPGLETAKQVFHAGSVVAWMALALFLSSLAMGVAHHRRKRRAAE